MGADAPEAAPTPASAEGQRGNGAAQSLAVRPLVGGVRRAAASWRVALVPLAVYAASRAVTLIVVLAGLEVRGRAGLMGALLRRDGRWYLQVAATGYPPLDPASASDQLGNLAGNGAFFPLYPLLIRVTGLTGLSPGASALTVSAVFGAAATVLLWLLVRHLAGERAADRSVVLFCFFPGAFVLSMAYAEPLMLFWSIACLYALVTRRWWTAGMAGALASATRPNGVILVVSCLWAAGVAIRCGREWRSVVAPLLAPVGFLSHLTYLWLVTGEPLAWMTIQRQGWHEFVDFGRATFVRTARYLGLIETPSFSARGLLPTLGLAFVIVAAVLLLRWRPPAVLTWYAAGIIGLAVIAHTLGPRPRFVLTAFPLVVAAAVSVRGVAFQVLAAASGALLCATTLIYVVAGTAIP